MGTSDGIETEVKLGAWPGFELPDLDGAFPGLRTEIGDPRTLDATYVDAPDLRLIRAGISLRHRTGEGGETGAWTLKLADDGAVADGALRRREIVVEAPPGTVPAELVRLVRPHLRTATVGTVAHLQTVRRSVTLVYDPPPPPAVEDGAPPVPEQPPEEEEHAPEEPVTGDEVPVAEEPADELPEPEPEPEPEPTPGPVVVGSVDDDEVSVLQGGRVAARFREVEVEIGAAAPDGLLEAVVARLREAGAGVPDPTPKLVRALGPRALQPPDLAPAQVSATDTAAEVLRAGITNAVLRIVAHEAVIRADDDHEGIHQARVGMRRLRSDLKTFAPLLDTAWSEPLREELKWLAGELGEVRDRDVLGARLRRQVEALPEGDREAALAVIGRLDRERAKAQAKVIAVLDGRRYLALLDRLVAAAREPRTRPEAQAPAVEVVPHLAADAFRKLRKGIRKLGKHPSDEDLHAARIKAKKARYAADVAVPVVGDGAKAFTKAMGGLQDVLGDHHDCSVAEAWLTEAVRSATKAQAFALGQLVAHQRHEADRLRGEWRAAWKAVDRPKLTEWMA